MKLNTAITKVLTKALVEPHIADLREGRVTQSALSERFGVSQSALSLFLKRHGYLEGFTHGRGGRHPTTTPEMLQAVAEASQPNANIAKIAREHGLEYLALQRRVKKLQVKSERVAQMQEAPTAQPTSRSLDETLLLVIMEDPVRLARAAAVLRAAAI